MLSLQGQRSRFRHALGFFASVQFKKWLCLPSSGMQSRYKLRRYEYEYENEYEYEDECWRHTSHRP